MRTNILLLLLAFIAVALVSCTAVSSSEVTVAEPTAAEAVPTPNRANLRTAVFAGGCFWGVEAVFEHTRGVADARSGFAGGPAKAATYDAVSTGETGHAESVEVSYDPDQVSYEQLLDIFFKVIHDPTELNRQGPDEGPQYRSAIFYVDETQKKAAEDHIARLTEAKVFKDPIVTQVAPLDKFYEAEAYHQDYARRNPKDAYIVYHDLPKVANLKKQFPALYIDRK